MCYSLKIFFHFDIGFYDKFYVRYGWKNRLYLYGCEPSRKSWQNSFIVKYYKLSAAQENCEQHRLTLTSTKFVIHCRSFNFLVQLYKQYCFQ